MAFLPIKPLLFGLLSLIFIFIIFYTDLSQATSIPSTIRKRNYKKNYYYAIELKDDLITTPDDVTNLLDIKYEGQIGSLANHHLFSSEKELTDQLTARSIDSTESEDSNDRVLIKYEKLKSKRHANPSSLEKRSVSTIDNIVSVEKQKLRKRYKRVPIPTRDNKDSRAENSNYSLAVNKVEINNDINITDVWKEGITGKGVVAAIIDDGLDMYSDDLADNFYAEGSYDYNDQTALPQPRLDDDTHGTRCAGEIAAVKNDVCGIGIAPDVKIAGKLQLNNFSILLNKIGAISDADEAEALNYKYQLNQIYSCSWGPPDDGQSVEGPQGLILKAMINGITNGRGGKGSLFVFASGNGASVGDNCNYDGYVNSIYTITVGAVDHTNSHPYYAEQCAALLVTAYSSGGGNYIYTTDVGKRNCTNSHGGTSAAAPIATGILSLVLQIRPDLSWRDVQYLTLLSAVPFNLYESDWEYTKAGRLFSYKWGYGKLDAYKIIQNAKTFKNLGSQVSLEMPIVKVNKKIPDTENGLKSKVNVTQELLTNANFSRLEHLTVTINIKHTRRGDIEVNLISPNKITSKLGMTREYDEYNGGLTNWTFMTLKHWDESPIGEWTLQVKDRLNPRHTATIPAVVTTTVTSTITSIASPTSPVHVGLQLPITNVWILTGIGMSIAFILVGCIYCMCLLKNKYSKKGNGKFKKVFGGDDYQLVSSPSGDTTNGADDSIPLARGSKESFNAFGDTSDDEDENTRVVFENAYMDEYMNEKNNGKVDKQNISSEVIEQRQDGGSSGTLSVEPGRNTDNN
ncbi:1388_t:CDS:2 [Diversispora eburnea]|uniref:1388_t:CDS:1 n=1 Tax=Diversispora eburnea TaxID=1213867 RepID=A0A9N9AHD2_9GLOM|nr:1388_t:CDS:2 [Diversispora eburnea]